MSELRRDAAAWRTKLPEGGTRSEGEVSRVVIDVRTSDGEQGLVTVSLHQGQLLAVDERGRSSSPLSDAALAWLAGLAAADATGGGSGEAGRVRTSLAPGAPRASLRPSARHGLEAARELALALVRSGVAGARRGALEELLRRARDAPDLRAARWAARFDAALRAEDVSLLAQLVRGVLSATQIATRERVDLHLLELAREHVEGARRGAIERRHLLEPATGMFFVEEREVSGPAASLGPCPRTLEVGLAEESFEAGRSTLRILQYTTSPLVGADALAQVHQLAERSVEALCEQHEAVLRSNPAFAEPIFLFAPSRWEAGPRVLDAEGLVLPLARDSDAASCLLLAELVTAQVPSFVVLRGTTHHGAHAFVPLACCLTEREEPVLVRLRG